MASGRHAVKLHGVTVGYSDLEDADPAMGRARGRFRPGVGYELVQPIFRLFTEAVPIAGGAVADEDKLARYHRSRDALGLSLEDDRGRVVATSAIHIADYSASRNGDIQLDVLVTDRDWWKRRGESA